MNSRILGLISTGILSAAFLAACASNPSASSSASNAPDLTTAEVAKLGWDAVPIILQHIHAPTFADKNFPITDYGAKADGTTDCTDAINKAIVACNKAGGGHVTVPDGIFQTCAIRLLSNVDLHLADKAKLQFLIKPDSYPQVPVRIEGVEYTNYSPLIYANGQENISVSGHGTLDGGGENNWVPVIGATYRMNFFVPYNCKNVIIDGLTINNSPMWEINPVYCTNVIVRNLNINSLQGNNDGCDPDSCKYVLIDHDTFNTGDDCIAIKCGKDDDGRRVNRPTQFVIVRDCTMQDGHGGCTLGSECTPGIYNVFVENCKMNSPHLNAFFRFKNSTARGGVIENAYMRNVQVGSVAPGGNSAAGFLVQYTYGGNGNYVPVLRNVNVSNVTGTNIPKLIGIQKGDTAVLENIQIKDCTFSGPNPDELKNEIEQNKNWIKFDNVTIKPATATAAN